jgi:nitrate reductase gamma subunit
MSTALDHLLFSVYPYIAATVLFVGSLIRFDVDQYSWRSKSSQLLRQRQLAIGSNLFHWGILVIFLGHFFGLLTPMAVFHALGIGAGAKQILAAVGGGIAGVAAWVGLTILAHRRLADPRIRKTSSFSDLLVLVLLWVQLTLGLATVPISLAHPAGEEMVKFMEWAQAIVYFRLGAAEHIAGVPLLFKLHLVLGMTILLITPFTRLVHIWSAPIWYLFRRWQVVRTKRVPRRREAALPGAVPALPARVRPAGTRTVPAE